MSERIVFAYRYASIGGPATVLLARWQALRDHFDVRFLFERDLGGVAMFPPDRVSVVPTFQQQADAIGELKPDLFAAIDAGWREPWIRAGSPGKLIVEVHTASPQLVFLSEIRAAQRIDLFIVPSRYLAGRLLERGMGDIAPIAIVPNALTSEWFRPADPWIPPAPILMWVGRLEPHKGVGRFLDIRDRLAARDLIPLLVGGTNDMDGEVMSTVARVYEKRWSRLAMWFPRVAYRSMPRLYATVARSGGTVVMTSDAESFSMTVAEAAMMGCPVVAPNVGGPVELLSSDALYPAGDEEGAAALISRVLSDASFRTSIAAAARAIIEPLVKTENALPAYLAALERAL